MPQWAFEFRFPRPDVIHRKLLNVLPWTMQGWITTGLKTRLGPRNQIRSSPVLPARGGAEKDGDIHCNRKPSSWVALLGAALGDSSVASGAAARHRGRCVAPVWCGLSDRPYRSVHHAESARLLLQPFFPCPVFSSGHDQDTAGVCDSGTKATRNLQNLCARRIRGDGRSRSCLWIQPLPGGDAPGPLPFHEV